MEKINVEDLADGTHFWAKTTTIKGATRLVMMMVCENYNSRKYEVCGPWECGMSPTRFEVIEIINKPKGYENTLLYY